MQNRKDVSSDDTTRWQRCPKPQDTCGFHERKELAKSSRLCVRSTFPSQWKHCHKKQEYRNNPCPYVGNSCRKDHQVLCMSRRVQKARLRMRPSLSAPYAQDSRVSGARCAALAVRWRRSISDRHPANVLDSNLANQTPRISSPRRPRPQPLPPRRRFAQPWPAARN